MSAPVERLKRRREFLSVAAARRKWVTPGMIVQFRPTQDGEPVGLSGHPAGPRVGFTVSRRVGNAVVRNRVRRRLRAVVERVMADHAAAGADYVLIGRAATASRPFPALVEDLETALRRLGAWRGEGGSPAQRRAAP